MVLVATDLGQALAGVKADDPEADAGFLLEPRGMLDHDHQAVAGGHAKLADRHPLQTQVARKIRGSQHAIGVVRPGQQPKLLLLAKCPCAGPGFLHQIISGPANAPPECLE